MILIRIHSTLRVQIYAWTKAQGNNCWKFKVVKQFKIHEIMTIRKQGKNLVLLLMTAIFFCMLGISILKWKDEKVGETQATKSAHKMFYPSVTMTPFFQLSFSKSRLAHFKTRKNLTEYYMNTSHITSDIISIQQNYELSNG